MDKTKSQNQKINFSDILLLLFLRISYSDSNFSFTKKELLDNLDRFQLGTPDINNLHFIGTLFSQNKMKNINLNKDEIFLILSKIDLTQIAEKDNHLLHYIFRYNIRQELNFTKEDIFYITQKYNLINGGKYGTYYSFEKNPNNIPGFTKKDLVLLMFRENLEYTTNRNYNIFVKEVVGGLIIDDEKIIKNILETKNKRIIDCVLKHIDQIKWKHDELLLFLKNNDLKITNKAKKCLQF